MTKKICSVHNEHPLTPTLIYTESFLLFNSRTDTVVKEVNKSWYCTTEDTLLKTNELTLVMINLIHQI